MADSTEPRWLSGEEMETWLALWSTMTWLPARLESQMKGDADISLAEYHTLSQISQAPERTMRLSELATLTNMTLSHLSRVAARLEGAGWIVRTPDPTNGRFTLASLTGEGMAKVVAAAPGHAEAVQRYVFDALTPEQAAAMGDALKQIVDVVNPPRRPKP